MFYLGTHRPNWLACVDVPLMVSRNTLGKYRTCPRARTSWVLDSGGFTELSLHGGWRIDAKTYAGEVARYRDEVGHLDWAAPQDWMCEPFMLAKTGKTVAEHQALTVGNYLDLRAEGAEVIPVLQGHTLADYEHCADLYDRAGVRLESEVTVGLGSVCRRQDTNEIGEVVVAMLARGIRCHGFGCKEGAIRRYGDMLASADSLAWSYGGRRRGTCSHNKSGCANCLHWALDWRSDVLAAPAGGTVQMAMPLGVSPIARLPAATIAVGDLSPGG